MNGKNAKPQSADAGGPAPVQPDAPGASAAEATPVSIAQHAEVYAQNLESMLARRAATAQPTRVEVPVTTEPTGAAPEAAEAGANGPLEVGPPQPQTAAAEVAREPQAEIPAASTLSLPTTRALTQAPAPDAPPQPQPQAAPSPAAPAAKLLSVATTSDQLLQKLAARVRDYPRDTAAQLEYQLLQFLRDEPVPELGPIAPLPAEDRELLTTLIDGLSNFRSALRADGNMLRSKKVSPLLEMGNRLRGQGDLTLPTARLCTRVDRFGVYEPMEPAQFRAGAPNEAVLYCEVANFSSQLGDRRQWETRLRHESVLYSELGLAVWQDKADAVTDLSRNRRHDFYVVKRLRVPPMPVGRYLLKVTVTDLQVNRVAEKTVPIQVVAP